MATEALCDVLENRYKRFASIEDNCKSSPANSSIELPAEIQELVTGSDYWRRAKENRYRKLIREGHLADLLELARLAPEKATKEHPSHWFAAWASKKNWDKTLATLANWRKAAQVVAEVAERIVAPAKHIKAVYAAYWRCGGNILPQAIKAQETARDGAFKYFCWLTREGSPLLH